MQPEVGTEAPAVPRHPAADDGVCGPTAWERARCDEFGLQKVLTTINQFKPKV